MRLPVLVMIGSMAALWIGPAATARCGQPAVQQPGAQQPQEVEVTIKMKLGYLLSGRRRISPSSWSRHRVDASVGTSMH